MCEPPPPAEACPALADEMCPMDGDGDGLDIPPLCGSLNPAFDLFGELAANCGAGCTCTNPDFATWWFMWLKLLIEPRGMPNPAEPACTVYRVPVSGVVVAAFPTSTVLVPPVGAINGVTWTNVVGR